jgi:hypothetical protein
MTISREEVQLKVNAAWLDAAEYFAGHVLLNCLERYLCRSSSDAFLILL